MSRIRKLIILGAGKPKTSAKVGSLIEEPLTDSTLLDWQLGLVSSEFDEVIYIAGFQHTELIEKYPELNVVVNVDWRTTGPIGSLRRVQFSSDVDYVIMYSDIVLSRISAELLDIGNDEIGFGYDGSPLESFSEKEKVVLGGEGARRFGYDCPISKNTFEFCGVIALKGETLNQILKNTHGLQDEFDLQTLSQFLEVSRLNGRKLKPLEIGNDWFEVSHQKELARKVLGTKAETLDRLRKMLKNGRILDQVRIEFAQWERSSENVASAIETKFAGKDLIIRSSAISEDGFESAFAGVFDSVLGVACETESITNAVEHVFSSYQVIDASNQVLVQPMLKDVDISGVLFTRTVDEGAPYYVVNFDDTSGLTDTVTAGTSSDLKTLKVARNASTTAALNEWQRKLLVAAEEIEDLLKLDELDIEFAVDQLGDVYIFQVRPLATLANAGSLSDDESFAARDIAKGKFRELQGNSKAGEPIFARMPDWNPAEIIGARPDFLSYSLYRKIITDRVWAQQRYENGNVDMRGQHLMTHFCGQPYVFVNASLLSFIPRALPEKICKKILGIALERYSCNPSYHDKIEFEIIPTCFDGNDEKWRECYIGEGKLSEEEFELWMDELRLTTKSQISSINQFIQNSKDFEAKFNELQQEVIDPVNKINRILALLQDQGTLAFAHLARCGFIAISVLQSCITKNPELATDVAHFQSKIKTVSTRFSNAAARVRTGELSSDEFLTTFGHLRPNSYNIYSPTYRDSFEELILSGDRLDQLETNKVDEKSRVRQHLETLAHQLEMDAESLEKFVGLGIEWREEAKFIFSRGLSEILEVIKEVDPHKYFSQGLVHHFGIEELLSLMEGDLGWEVAEQIVNLRKNRSHISRSVELPESLVSLEDFDHYFVNKNEINFIGRNSVVCELADLSNSFDEASGIDGKVVLIESADPGFDWIFGHAIAGLITQYGGANSHMAIRAAEYGIPAAIGIGELHKERISGAKSIELDCANKILRPMQ